MEESLPQLIEGDLPDLAFADPYSPVNDEYVIGLNKALAAADQYAQNFEPWQVAYTKIRAEGVSQKIACKEVKKSIITCREFEKTVGAQELTSYYRYIRILKSPISKEQRAHFLWRIAVDNEKVEPDTARKAINDLNSMLDPKASGGGMTLNIQINNETLPRGPLDG